MFFGIFFWALNRQRVQSQRATESVLLMSRGPLDKLEVSLGPAPDFTNDKLKIMKDQVICGRNEEKLSDNYMDSDSTLNSSEAMSHVDATSEDSYSSEMESMSDETSRCSDWSLSSSSRRMSIRSLQSSNPVSLRSVMSYMFSVLSAENGNGSWTLSESSSFLDSITESSPSFSMHCSEKTIIADEGLSKSDDDAFDEWSHFSDFSCGSEQMDEVISRTPSSLNGLKKRNTSSSSMSILLESRNSAAAINDKSHLKNAAEVESCVVVQYDEFSPPGSSAIRIRKRSCACSIEPNVSFEDFYSSHSLHTPAKTNHS
jgi:hypothetical protein